MKYPRLYGGSDGLDQVEREAVAIRRVGVQKAESRVEAASASRQSALAFGYCVRVIKEAIGWVD